MREMANERQDAGEHGELRATMDQRLGKVILEHTSNNLMIVGLAGVGKSTFLYEICVRMRRPELAEGLQILATQNKVAADNGGKTLASMFMNGMRRQFQTNPSEASIFNARRKEG